MNPVVELGARVALWWADNRPFSKEAKARRKAKRAARKAARNGPQPDIGAGEFFQQEEDTNMLNGYKTYIGIATAALGLALGWLGFGEAEAADVSAQIIDALDKVLTIGGLVIATYGRAKAKPQA